MSGCPAKTAISAISPKNYQKIGKKSQFLPKLTKLSVRGGRRAPSKNCDFCNFSKIAKNWRNRSFC